MEPIDRTKINMHSNSTLSIYKSNNQVKIYVNIYSQYLDIYDAGRIT